MRAEDQFPPSRSVTAVNIDFSWLLLTRQLTSEDENPKRKSPHPNERGLCFQNSKSVLLEAYLLRHLLHMIVRIAVGVVCGFATAEIDRNLGFIAGSNAAVQAQ